MKLSGTLALALLLGALVLRFIWLPLHDRAIRQETERRAAQQGYLAGVDSMRARARVDSTRWADAANVQQADYRRQFAALGMARRAATDSLRSLLDSLLASLPDTAPLARAIVAERAVGTACDLSLQSCGQALALETTRLRAAEGLATRLGMALDSTRGFLEAAEKRGRRRLQIRPGVGGCALWTPGDGTVRAGPCAFVGIVF